MTKTILTALTMAVALNSNAGWFESKQDIKSIFGLNMGYAYSNNESGGVVPPKPNPNFDEYSIWLNDAKRLIQVTATGEDCGISGYSGSFKDKMIETLTSKYGEARETSQTAKYGTYPYASVETYIWEVKNRSVTLSCGEFNWHGKGKEMQIVIEDHNLVDTQMDVYNKEEKSKINVSGL